MPDTADTRDIHGLEAEYLKALQGFREAEWHIPVNKQYILDFLRDCELGKTIKKGQKRIISKARCYRMMGILKNLSHWLNKDFKAVTTEDMERFIYDFQNDVIVQLSDTPFGARKKNKPYAESTKCTIKKVIRKFFKWLDGGKHYPDSVEWMDTSEPDIEIPSIPIDEVKLLMEAAKHPHSRAFIAIIFETGARVGEMLNVRIPEDITRDQEYNLPLITIRSKTSKTKGRTVPIAIFKDELELYMKHINAHSPNQKFLFPMQYKSTLELLRRLGMKVLGKSITNNIIRHSSATHFANNVETAAQMNYRYGWSMSSKMAQRYIDRAGVTLIKSAEKSITNQLTRKKADQEGLVIRNRYLELEVRSLREELQRIKTQVSVLVEELKESGQLGTVVSQHNAS